MNSEKQRPQGTFDPLSYIEMYFKAPEGHQQQSQVDIKFFQWSKQAFEIIPACQNGIEIGCGPVLNLAAFASKKISNLMLTQFNTDCFKFIQAWVRQQKSQYNLDWSKHFQAIAHYEGTVNAKTVEDRLRKSIVSCSKIDLRTDQVFQWPFFRKVDTIISSLCLESASKSDQAYKKMVKNLRKYLKPDGYIYFFGVLQQTYYYVLEQRLPCHYITQQLIKQSLQQNGFQIIKLNILNLQNPGMYHADLKGVFSVVAQLKQP